MTSPNRKFTRNQLRGMKKAAVKNYRVFFNAMCRMPLKERIKAATRIIFKRSFK